MLVAAAHYTPPTLARHLVRESLGRWLWRGPPPDSAGREASRSRRGSAWRAPEELFSLRILDPACGNGAFLVAARELLLEYLAARAAALAPATPPQPHWRQKLVTEVLHGVDVDRAALAAAHRNLFERAGDELVATDELPSTLRHGNALLAPHHLQAAGVPGSADDTVTAWDPAGPLGFPAVLARGGFDVILGNPPYAALGSLAATTRRLLSQTYQLGAHARPDLYQLFYERTLGELLRAGGLHVFLVPDALVARDEHGATRRLVCERLAIERIIRMGAVFPDSGAATSGRAPVTRGRPASPLGVATVGVIGRKRPAPAPRAIQIERWRDDRVIARRVAPAAALCPRDGGPWALAAPRTWFGPRGFRARVEAPGLRLRELLAPGAAGLTRGEELGKSRLASWTAGEPCATGHVPILAGEDLQRHRLAAPRHQVPRQALRKLGGDTAAPRVLLVKTGAGLVAAPSTDDWPVLQSVYVLRLAPTTKTLLTEPLLAALLCSAVLTAYAWFRWTAAKAIHPQLTLRDVAELPLPAPAALAAARPELLSLTEALTLAPQRTSAAELAAADRALDERVAALYGLRFDDWEPLLLEALTALPSRQRSRWVEAAHSAGAPAERP